MPANEGGTYIKYNATLISECSPIQFKQQQTEKKFEKDEKLETSAQDEAVDQTEDKKETTEKAQAIKCGEEIERCH